jgi:hypothetical protein
MKEKISLVIVLAVCLLAWSCGTRSSVRSSETYRYSDRPTGSAGTDTSAPYQNPSLGIGLGTMQGTSSAVSGSDTTLGGTKTGFADI